jgi:hypothetical protein
MSFNTCFSSDRSATSFLSRLFLILKPFEPLRLINPKTTVFLSVSVIALLGRADLLARHCQALALAL